MLQCESADVALRFGCCSAIPFARGESGVILFVPSRFEEGTMVELELGYFGDARLKKMAG